MCVKSQLLFFFFFFLSLTKLRFDLLKLSAGCALGWLKCLGWSVRFCIAHAKPTGSHERPELRLFKSNTCCKYVGVLLHVWTYICPSFEVVLSFPAFLSHDRRDRGMQGWWSGGLTMGIWDGKACSALRWGEQVEVWILHFRGRKKQNLHSAGQYLLPWQLHWKERMVIG